MNRYSIDAPLLFTDCVYTLFNMSQAPPAKKRKRVVLTLVQKICIIERLEAGEVAVKLAHEYGVGNSTISDIKKGEEKILINQPP